MGLLTLVLLAINHLFWSFLKIFLEIFTILIQLHLIIRKNVSITYCKKSVLYLYHERYISSVNELKSFREEEYVVYTKEVKDGTNNTVDNDVNSIKEIIDFYFNTYKIKYVLLFGDYEEITSINTEPTFNPEGQTSTNTKDTLAACDNWYGVYPKISDPNIQNTNSKFEIIIGRLSPVDMLFSNRYTDITNEEKVRNVQNQIDKIKDYETNINNLVHDVSNRTWFKKNYFNRVK